MNTEWKPIASAPKDGSSVLLRGKGDHRIADGYWLQAAYNGVGAWVWPYVHSEPVHWMPLPSEPCATCNGHGMIGGPSFYAPDEGGERCPDCSPPAPTSHPIPTGATGEDEQAAFEDWMERTCPSGDVEAVQHQWESSSDYADFHAPPAGDVQGVPAEVMAALDRMCTPLDQSWLKGVTAEADAKCMQTIRDYILHRPACAPAAGDALDGLVDRLAGMAYSFAVRLDQASRGANGDELEGVARRVTADLKEQMRAAIAQQSQRKEA